MMTIREYLLREVYARRAFCCPDESSRACERGVDDPRCLPRVTLPPGYNYFGVSDYVLDRGKDFESSPLTAEEEGVLDRAVETCLYPHATPRHCFSNAQVVVLSDETSRLQYVEGVALGPGGFPVHHGWMALNGKVIDMTWDTPEMGPVLGQIPTGWAYRGVTFDRDYCRRLFNDDLDDYVGTILDDFVRGYPVFKQPRLKRCPVGADEYPQHTPEVMLFLQGKRAELARQIGAKMKDAARDG